MSVDQVTGSPQASGPASAPAADSRDVARVAELATQFESMLLGQMLKEMRQAGSWKEEGDGDAMGGGQALFEALDVELALRLSKAQSLGLRDQFVRQVTGRSVAAPAVAPAAFPLTGAAGLTGGGEGVSAQVTSGFGWRPDPMTGAAAFHRGIDVRAAYGATVASAGPGAVVFAGTQGGYGQTVVVDHGNGLQTRYAHLSVIGVRVGDTLGEGSPVGQAGQTGRATGTHVHFEATVGGQPVDPESVPERLKGTGSGADVKAGRSELWRQP
jgi:murein DD-endopeptidase MepM/ murein hydrolase activator NlpD